MRHKFGMLMFLAAAISAYAQESNYLGRLSSNPFDSQSVANLYGVYGSRYSPNSINNPYGQYGSAYSPFGVSNPYTFNAPRLIAQDGTYLGRLSANPFDPDSVSNPCGRYGSPYSPTSIKNPYGVYGSPYSNKSPNNPYATQPPLIIGTYVR